MDFIEDFSSSADIYTEKGRLLLSNIYTEKIEKIYIDDNELFIEFKEGVLKLWDNGQACCEHRYIRTDDNLDYYIGSKINKIGIADAPNEKDEYGVHEVQFLNIYTDRGVITFSNHNEHNGYYGGISLRGSYSLKRTGKKVHQIHTYGRI